MQKSSLDGQMPLNRLEIKQRSYYNLWELESQPQNPEFQIDPKNYTRGLMEESVFY